MTEKLLIVAGNHAEAKAFAEAKKLQPRQWDYVRAERDILGRRSPLYMLVGTWRERDDIASVEQRLFMIGGVLLEADAL